MTGLPTRTSPCAHSTRKPEVTRTITVTVRDTEAADSKVDGFSRAIAWSGPTDTLFGHSLDDIEKNEEWWTSRIHENDRSRVVTSFSDQLHPRPGNPYDAGSRIWGCDYQFRHANGEYLLICDRSIITRDEQGNVQTIVSVMSDKKKRKVERTAREQLLKSQNHLAIIADNTPSGIFMMDPQGYTTYMNAAGEGWLTVLNSEIFALLISIFSGANYWIYIRGDLRLHFPRGCA